MKMNKEQFLKTEFGGELESTITAWDDALSRNREDKEVLRTLAWCQAQWEVYRMAIKHFYGVEYHFTRTDEYYGLCTEDESDWLMRVKRVKLFQMKTMFSRQRVTRRGIRIDGVEYWDDDFVHLNLGKTVIAECTPWLIRVYTEAGTPARLLILLFFNFHSPSFSVIRYFFLYRCYKITYSVIIFRDIMAFVLLVHFDYISCFGYCQFRFEYILSYFE